MIGDTSGNNTPLRYEYPGLGLPLRAHDQSDHGFYPIGAHEACRASESDLIPVRELAAMDIMEKLTDKENWHQKIFDEDVVAKWRKEALAVPDKHFWDLATNAKRPWNHDDDDEDGDYENDRAERITLCRFRCKLENIMDEDTFQTCIEELRSKAKYFEISGIIPTLEASASIAKSDTIVSAELHDGLQAAFDRLKADHAASPDWHPKSNSMVQDLVHPSMYPLVYGRTLGFQAEQVGVADAIKHWAGKGNVIPKDVTIPPPTNPRRLFSGVPPEYWSETYQWLPANVAFKENGGVKFTSYVNNLHPTRYPEVYRAIEKLIETSIPMWDQCLRMEVSYHKYQGAGRLETRTGQLDHPDDDHHENWIPDNAEACADVECSENVLEHYGYTPRRWRKNDEDHREELLEAKWRSFRKPRIPPLLYKHVDYTPHASRRLVEKFSTSGLQVIVKMASIELTPEKPEFPVGGWHVEGQMNEHICATALYYLDSENVSEDSLSFRMPTSSYISDEPGFDVGQDSYSWLEQIYGTGLGIGDAPCLQNYGHVQTRQGRLLAFPNVFQHRVSPFKLMDPTKPGHRRFIALWLVDPTKRIISTANIPPQQMTWYKDALLGSDGSEIETALSELPPDLVNLLAEQGLPGSNDDRETKLPQELMDCVRDYFYEDKHSLPMSVEEANEHRAKLMEERGAFVRKSGDAWQSQTYSFCEH